MDIGAILILLAVGLLTALFVAQPFLMGQNSLRSISKISEPNQEISSLMAERDRLIGALQELDFDHTLGKIPAADYPGTRAGLLQHAADVLRKLDELQPQAASGEDAENRVEAVIAARRADASNVSKGGEVTDNELEDLIAARRMSRKEKSVGFCPHCGKPIVKSDRFCPACGHSILD